MTISQQPSIRTEGPARAPKTALRLIVVAIAMLTVSLAATPASAQTVLPGPSGAVSQPSTGEVIANYALQFVGYPYVWAGSSPAGFDCSGFTNYVILNTVGIDIGRGVPGQTNFGAFVDWGAWQPGDLVFFANTYAAGISHVGIYIGDGQFVHAENEGTGVVISSLYSDYYSGHYHGAYRIG